MRFSSPTFKRFFNKWRSSPYLSVISLTVGTGLVAQNSGNEQKAKKEEIKSEEQSASNEGAKLNKNVYNQHEFSWRGVHGKEENDSPYLSISPELATSAHDESNNVVWVITNTGNDLKKPMRVINYRLQAICEALKEKGFEPKLLSALDVEIMIANNQLGATGTRESRLEQTQIKATRFAKDKARANEKRDTIYRNAKKDYSETGVATTVDTDRDVKLPRFVIARTGSSSEFREYSLFQFLESLGVPVCNSSISIAYAANKMLTYILLAENHVPVPNTFCLDFELFFFFFLIVPKFFQIDTLKKKKDHSAHSKSPKNEKLTADDLLQKHNTKLPMVLKLQVIAYSNHPFYFRTYLNSSCGRGVFLARDKQELEQLLRICEYLQPNSEVILQECMNESFGMDVRVWVVGDKVVGAVRRINNNPDFRSNVAAGGKANSVQLDDDMKQLAIRATHVLGLDFAGVDLLLDHRDPVTGKCSWRVGEVNSSPGWDESAEDMGLQMPTAIIDHICSRYDIKVKPQSQSKPADTTNPSSNAAPPTKSTTPSKSTNKSK
ncbi:alpha-L-glutamate ligase [Reticulomyxa filosa]|uniref:Alpha-L-glutamate ligase n=1 Tax=Reticulomyxa filosa TaxID=46433 RepID=X6MJ53_RETFI|nr:alpha-L-glutamate ligase [Reticulomyxa filosa]|eukprot:ETO14048.1 alpha-L-glutamate ligase [Reticulomyxa filosa]